MIDILCYNDYTIKRIIEIGQYYTDPTRKILSILQFYDTYMIDYTLRGVMYSYIKPNFNNIDVIIDCRTCEIKINGDLTYNEFLTYDKYKTLDDQLKIIATHEPKRHWCMALHKSHYTEILQLLHTLNCRKNQ